MLYSILIAGMFTFVCEKEGGGGKGRERNNGVSGMHDRTDGRTALREIALHASDGNCASVYLSPFVGLLLCPLVCRSPAACQGPDVLLPAHLRSSTGHLSLRILPTRPLSVPPPSVRQAPDASRFRERPSGNACSRRTGRK